MVTPNKSAPTTVVIIGAGPAGLTAASELCKSNVKSVVLEKDTVVGGISRTVSYKGYLFDIGGHRFFTKVKAVEDMWHDYMESDFLLRSRTSRILYNKKFFNYPLKISNALSGLGLKTSVMVLLSYIRIRIFPIKSETNFEEFVSNMFGRRLYRIFFKTYTEKVWGIPCTELSAEWAAQRIKGLSLVSAVKNALIGNRFKTKQTVIKTLIDSFHYPRLGPGMMWENVTKSVNERGSDVRMDSDVTKIATKDGQVEFVETVTSSGQTDRVYGSHFISTMPIRELIAKMEPPPPQPVLDAAKGLNYRDFLTVALVIDRPHMFDDNWIYIHDDSVQVGRVQNFKNWSPEMVPDEGKTCLGLEYFCFEGDGLWTSSDEDLVAQGIKEMQALGFLKAEEVVDGTVVRMPKAYPVYNDRYAEEVETVRQHLLTNAPNLQLVGRNGMHKYNNQDHSMLTAMLAAENILGANNDLWTVNVEKEYHEELSSQEAQRQTEMAEVNKTQPLVPTRVSSVQSSNLNSTILNGTYAQLDKLSLAVAVGILFSVVLLMLTLALVAFGSPLIGEQMELLGQYFIGYTVTYKGALIGAIYGFVWGFLLGWLTAYLRNLLFGIYLNSILRREKLRSGIGLLDYI